MAENVTLSVSLRTSGQTAALKSGEITIPGVTLHFVEVEPQVAAFRRMVRSVEFDVCELAATTYMVARGHGSPFKALPVFLNRRFHHHGLLVRPDSGINEPKDLEGKKVGVRAYSVTTGVWTRGILQNEYGVDLGKVTWMVDDEEHVAQLQLPENVLHVPEGRSLAGMMAAGEIEAGLQGNAGIGREGPPTENWSAKATLSTDDYRELIPDASAREAEWFARTGIYPFHPTIVIKDEVVAAHPEVPRLLYEAMAESKKRYLEKLNNGEATAKADNNLRKMAEIVGPDPVPYGLEANMPSIEALMTYAVQQKLMPSPMEVGELFHDPENI
ncbi:ABC transporter substrate-binding protein [Aliiruegeria lutimaris]|uniref:4,5-dihydroxyphthalate decarboxylase n=1 Tax=Aliiruegeria lutimaris TaxID=571298 RepID=A0A1G9AEN9_9RHOB|nr:PhnD/SsuA/transferrin family substrate-binding protein [Aliiruegeria lutimaris]SDK25819.1 4,5-dihydroxyphthalate decarboxylase [Aliiruegeria lutimaris]